MRGAQGTKRGNPHSRLFKSNALRVIGWPAAVQDAAWEDNSRKPLGCDGGCDEIWHAVAFTRLEPTFSLWDGENPSAEITSRAARRRAWPIVADLLCALNEFCNTVQVNFAH